MKRFMDTVSGQLRNRRIERINFIRDTFAVSIESYPERNRYQSGRMASKLVLSVIFTLTPSAGSSNIERRRYYRVLMRYLMGERLVSPDATRFRITNLTSIANLDSCITIRDNPVASRKWDLCITLFALLYYSVESVRAFVRTRLDPRGPHVQNGVSDADLTFRASRRKSERFASTKEI